MDSILNTVKRFVGLTDEDPSFDDQLLVHINSALAALAEIGVGPKEGYRVTGADESWAEFMGESPQLNLVQDYVSIKVKLVFDPPQNQAVKDALEQTLAENTWRIDVRCGRMTL